MASLGAEDLCLKSEGKIQYHLQQQLKGYKWIDQLPTHIKPIPFLIINHVNLITHTSGNPHSVATMDLFTIGFFFLLCSGEHMHPAPGTANQPFLTERKRDWKRDWNRPGI